MLGVMAYGKVPRDWPRDAYASIRPRGPWYQAL